MSESHENDWHPGLLLGAAILLAGLALVVELPSWKTASTASTIACAEMVDATASLDERQLAEFLTIPERYQRQQVQAIVRAPKCRLSSLEVRSGVTADREAYPLAFQPKQYLVILYEGEEYAGYTIGPR